VTALDLAADYDELYEYDSINYEYAPEDELFGNDMQ
jgi:hypothetical protein